MSPVSVFLSSAGAVLLLHAAYSCMHYRSILQDLDLNDDPSYSIPPVDVYVEVAVSFGMIVLGELIGMGSLQPVDIFASSKKRKPLMAPAHRTRDFDLYCNRSKAAIFKSS
jgi:Membrane magnesium transporter